ncbi:sugar ABC transporter ATP-binding protein [Hansschlegelia sp. KR7-227]|uniref:sugar ABC transporter ATP-binding protein n=1 Tax=Hansschlegelia sp. KR7-227 TaxID=3400914 RepID=UPI003C055DCB
MTDAPPRRTPGEPPLLELLRVSKQYPGVLALDAMNFNLRPGEVHVLFGENGAGKSTMISIISGAIQPTSGDVLMRGELMRFASVHEARSRGVTTVFQEFSVVPSMTVEENLFLGSETRRGGFLAKRKMREEARAILARLGFELNPKAIVSRLTRAEQQMVEIARAFRSDLSVLILDEPTASLTDREADRLFALVDQVKAQGVGIIYITHRMREIERLADRITVLRDGKFVTTVDAKDVTQDELVRLMTGRVVGGIFPDIKANPGRTVLSIRGLTTASGSVKSADIDVRAGELVGLAGLVGSGKSEIMRAAFGLERAIAGSVTLEGKDVTNQSPRRLLRAGFSYMPPDRRVEGLAMMRSCTENMTFASLDIKPIAKGFFINRVKEDAEARRLADKLELHPRRPDRAVQAFSGGNQQKVLLARSLTRPISLYVFDEPTVGVDVGTRAAIYRFIGGLCEAGAAVVVVSSDLPEILNLAHRAYVFYDGRVQDELSKARISEASILPLFFGKHAA